MHFPSSSLLLAAVAAPLAGAFPAAMWEAAARDPTIIARAEQIQREHMEKRQVGADAAAKLFEPVPVFDAKKQYINVTKGSGHEYVAPSGDDLRGPCPGLNAFANHNFLPHDGYATIQQFIDVTEQVVGMGSDLSTFLAVYGAAIDGDLQAWSIAGTPSLAQGGPTGILGHGLVGSHNKYEGDASPTRPDLYEAGNDYITESDQFQELVNACRGGEITMDCLTDFRSYRNDVQIANNKYYFYGPFTGILVQPAAYTFIYRFMANHTAERPEGILNYSVLQSWFGVQGSNGNYKAVQGTERIPDNWYRRPQAYPYSIPYFMADVLNAAALHPKFLNIGGNTGTTNSFTGVDLADLTGGVFNGQTLAQGNNLGCFVYQLSAQAKPDVATGPLTKLQDVIGDIIKPLGCPQLQAIDNSQLEAFPGYSKNPVYAQS